MPLLSSEAPQRPFRMSRPVPVFFGLAFAISWTFWGLAIIAQDTPLGVFGGSTCAWFKGLWHWRAAPKFWLFALGFPVALALAASALFGLLGGQVTLTGLGARAALWLPTFLTVTLIGGGNEEPGWRGFALPELQKTLSPFYATLGLGVLWELWHIPLIGARGGGFGAFVLSGPEWIAIGLTLASITAHAFWYTWLYNRTGSVLLCVILHSGYNAANSRFVLVQSDNLHATDERSLLLIMTCLVVVSVLALLAATQGHLGRAARA